MLSICSDQLKFEENCIPRCLCSVTYSNWQFSKNKLGRWFTFFKWKNTAFVLCGLNFNNHFFDHSSNILRSWLRFCSIRLVLSEHCCKELSSAYYNLHTDIIFSATSFTYNKNNNGPSTEPWGTPALTWPMEEKIFLYITICVLLLK